MDWLRGVHISPSCCLSLNPTGIKRPWGSPSFLASPLFLPPLCNQAFSCWCLHSVQLRWGAGLKGWLLQQCVGKPGPGEKATWSYWRQCPQYKKVTLCQRLQKGKVDEAAGVCVKINTPIFFPPSQVGWPRNKELAKHQTSESPFLKITCHRK